MSLRKRRNPDLGKAEILDAATRLFARNGFERTSLGEIGAAASVSRGLPAYFFANKESLYSAAMERATKLVRTAVLEPVKENSQFSSPREFVTALVNAYIDFLAAHPLEVRLLQWELLQPVQNRRQPALEALFEEGVELFRRWPVRSSRRRPDARHLLFSLVGMCLFPFLMNEQPFQRDSLRQYKRRVIAMATWAVEGDR